MHIPTGMSSSLRVASFRDLSIPPWVCKYRRDIPSGVLDVRIGTRMNAPIPAAFDSADLRSLSDSRPRTVRWAMLAASSAYDRGATCDAPTMVVLRQPGDGEPMAMITLTIALAVLVGVTLGLLGGGGSILTVPLLAYVAGMDAKEAISTSLLVVGVTSAVGAISHARAGRVQWRTGLLFGGAGMVGAYAGGRLARIIPGTVLLIAFAVIMIATAVAMLRGRKEISVQTTRRIPCRSSRSCWKGSWSGW